MAAATSVSDPVQVTFGLLATDKKPLPVPVGEVAAKVAEIARRGTNVGYMKQAHDTYEYIGDSPKIRAFMDLDIKRYVDGTVIPKLEGIVIREELRDVFREILPALESLYTTIVFGDSSGMKSATDYCVSFRLWFPHVVGSKAAVHTFAESVYKTHMESRVKRISAHKKINWDDFFDISVYTGKTKIRLPGCTKQGERFRPLQIDEELSTKDVGYTDVLVSYLPPSDYRLELSETSIPATSNSTTRTPKSLARPDSTHHSALTSATISDSVFALLTKLADLIPDDMWNKNAERFKVISVLWGAEQSPRMREFIYAQSDAKNPGNDLTAIASQIQRVKYPAHPAFLRKTVWRSNPEAAEELRQAFREDWSMLFGNVNQYVREITEDADTTDEDATWTQETYSERFVKPYPVSEFPTITVQSHMGTGKTVNIIGSKAHDIPALATKERFPRVLVLAARRTYTYSILGDFHAEGLTYYRNYLDIKGHDLGSIDYLFLQVESLHRLGTTCAPYNLIVMDESESLLAQMHSVGTHGAAHRTNYETLEFLVRNADTVLALDAFVTERTTSFLNALRSGPRLFVRNTYQPYSRTATQFLIQNGKLVLPDFLAMRHHMVEQLQAGKRIVCVTTSKEKGQELLDHLSALEIPALLHCGDDNAEHKKKLCDIRTSWATYKAIIYTSTITVGISYSDVKEEDEFDFLYLYASAGCALPRDVAQALLRVRKIRSNQLYFCVESRCVKPSVYGRKAIIERVNKRKTAMIVKDFHWAETPDWVNNLICHNENEITVSRRFYSDVLNHYLVRSGYTFAKPIIKEVAVKSEDEAKRAERPAYDEIDLIDFTRVQKIKDSGSETTQEIWLCEKFFFRSRFGYGAEEEFIGDMWKLFMIPPEGKKRTLEQQFWNIVHERGRNLELEWKAEVLARYAEQARITLKQQETITRLCKVIGISSTLEERTLPYAEFLRCVPDILALESDSRDAMGLRAFQGKGKESDFLHACSFLNSAFTTWSGTHVDKTNEKRHQKEGMRFRTYDIRISPLNAKLAENLL